MELSCLVVRGEIPPSSGSKYPAVVCAAAGRAFRATREATLYPHFDEVRLKNILRLPDGRYVVRLKGVSRRRLVPGGVLIASGQPFFRSRNGYAVARRPIRAGEYRMTGGLFRGHVLPGSVTVVPQGPGYRLTASADLPLVVGGHYRIVSSGAAAGRKGVDASSSGGVEELVLCLPLEIEKGERSLLGTTLAHLGRLLGGGGLSRYAIDAAVLRLAGWVIVADQTAVRRTLEAASSAEGDSFEQGEVVTVSGPMQTRLLVATRLLAPLESAILKAATQEAGATLAAIVHRTARPYELVAALVGHLEGEGRIVRDRGIYLTAGTRAKLSPVEQGVLSSLEAHASSGGFPRAEAAGKREILDRLVRRRVAVRLGERYLTESAYLSFAHRLLAGRNPGEAIDLAEARRLLGFSREQTVQFLQSLDLRGVLRRDGNSHRVVKGLETGIP